VSSADRDAARRSLARFQAPTQILVRTHGDDMHLAAISYAVETLIQVAQPLPGPLRQRLAPWFSHLAHLQKRILAETHRADRPALGRPTR
jgi:hypothetical protein